MSTKPFEIERVYNAPIDRVWQAITDKKKMKEWYFDLSDFRPEVGFEFQFVGEKDKVKFLHLCKVTEVEAGKKLAYSWTYQGYEGYSVVSFELFPDGEGTRLKLTHVGLESFVAFAKEDFVAGWTHIIGKSLKEFVEKE